MTEDSSKSSEHDDFQVVDRSQVFHEYAIVKGRIVKVSAWWPPERLPWEPGLYQGLVKRAQGEKVIKFFLWDGAKWRNNDTGKFTTQPFEWRGLASDPATTDDQF